MDDIPQQVADDIQGFALMICNSCGIDDIHGCAVIGMRPLESKEHETA